MNSEFNKSKPSTMEASLILVVFITASGLCACRAIADAISVQDSAGKLVTALLILPDAVKANDNRVFELRIYHAVPGKLRVMESRFRDKTSKILSRHNLKVVGYWVTDEEKDNCFVFLLAHSSREQAKSNWAAFGADPEFQEVAKSEQADRTLEKAEIVWLHPTDFSPTK